MASATATDPWPARWIGPLLLAGLALAGCSEQPLPQEQGLRSDDCLRNVTLERLQEQISLCDEVVKAFPDDPSPRNDRYLLHSLAGNDEAACADLGEAVRLAGKLPPEQLDKQLRSDLEVRLGICGGVPLTTPAAPPAPSP